MNCIYCERKLFANGTVKFICLTCPSSVQYLYGGDPPEIYYIQFYKDKYQLEMNIVDQKSHLFYLPYGGPPDGTLHPIQHLITFDDVPDVNPTTFEAWLERILAMKAFF